MPVESAADLAGMFDPDEFGVAVLYVPVDPFAASFTLDGIFDRRHVAVDFGAGAPVSAMEVTLRARLSAFPAGVAPQEGDTATIAADRYTVVDVQPDGALVTLVLSARETAP